MGEYMFKLLDLLRSGAISKKLFLYYKGIKVGGLSRVIQYLRDLFIKMPQATKDKLLSEATKKAGMPINSQRDLMLWMKANPIDAILLFVTVEQIAEEALDLLFDWVVDPKELEDKEGGGDGKTQSSGAVPYNMAGSSPATMPADDDYKYACRLLNGEENLLMLARVLNRLAEKK
jgi:hypothetical protein